MKTSLDFRGEILHAIKGVAKKDRFTSSETDLRGKRDAVAVANVKRTWGLGDGDDFVAGGEDGDAGFLVAIK